MSVMNFNLRGVPFEIMSKLKQEAKKQNTSVNFVILKFLEQSIGHSRIVKKSMYHDLDKLAGAWSKKDLQEFESSTKDFERIDKELWK